MPREKKEGLRGWAATATGTCFNYITTPTSSRGDRIPLAGILHKLRLSFIPHVVLTYVAETSGSTRRPPPSNV